MQNLERRSTIEPLHPRSPRQASARRAIPGVILQVAVLITAAWALRQVADALQQRFQNAEAPGVGVPPGSGGAGGLSPPEPTPEGSGLSADDIAQVRQRIDHNGLLFKVRVVSSEVRERQKARNRMRAGQSS